MNPRPAFLAVPLLLLAGCTGNQTPSSAAAPPPSSAISSAASPAVSSAASSAVSSAASSAVSPAASSAVSSAAKCGSPVLTDALPKWALGGFNYDGSGTPHVLSKAGNLVAVLFGSPLNAPPSDDHSNKILWVSKLPAIMGDTLRITANLAGTTSVAEREVTGGPGPSIVDLPQAGCWHLTLTWAGQTDSLDLTYQPPS
jgi:hypothetical protein